ncbi:sporulation protein YunB [Acutalibacter intestini]|uniref:sporulation protein YunB n=1 Tax=Acutalibacter intestini TaxID=3093659 RepID=UPI002AC9D323|nr:sporulation protein YunB [Acutalibacter sp. M00204]
MAIFVPVVLCLLVLGLSELGLGGVSGELTREAARGYILDCVSQAVQDELEAQSEPFVTVQRQESGQVSLVTADAKRLNKLKAGVLERLSQSLRGQATAQVPVGSLTGIGLLSGRGFPVPIKLRLEGSAVVEFSTEFASAGVNQTCHRLIMTVRAQAYSQSKRFETAVETETATVLAETLVVGEVPKWMAGK